MAALQASSLLVSSSSSSSFSSGRSSKRTITASIQVPKPSKLGLGDPPSAAIAKKLVEELSTRNGYAFAEPLQMDAVQKDRVLEPRLSPIPSVETIVKLYAILEAVEDRVEMHDNIGEQRDNWNKLLLNSVNMMTLTASTTAAMAAAAPAPSLRVCSALLFTAATGMSLVMSKIQPSQLAEEQRKASRLFKQLRSEIQSMLALQSPTESDVEETMEKVLALDRAYPLPLLGAMIEKFPAKFEPAAWWPRVSNNRRQSRGRKTVKNREQNGWSKDLEVEMRAIIQVLKSKDKQDYLRLGNLALKLNKMLAISGPLLAGIATAGSAFGGSTATTVAAIAGAMAAIINSFEHGGQVGMVVEMYRNGAGFFELMEETIEATLEEQDYSKRENGEMFEMKVAMKLGQSLLELRDLARKSMASCIEGTDVDEFGSKLF
ncbi:probable F-box protein At4g22030 [Rhodamnia argentea]|uniref:Probable F-box protein At4g22030 n=1 Tax=Rhodamnia argentea TaxID=178133 RepID=A0A8B8MP43_9MYRT|nr:probable F-box protein At4g22030 [Rhodamnia argentea]